MRVKFIANLIFYLLCAGLWSCTKSRAPGLVIVAVENLSSEELNCGKDLLENENSGLGSLCKEAYRFTHMYSPSTLVGPALASLLTGQSPHEHGYRAHENYFLSPKVRTLAEDAVEEGWRTVFISGGAPILRKTGLNQGFESFDDHWLIRPSSLFRPFVKSLEDFQNWMEEITDDESFLVTFYVPDLLYPKSEVLKEKLVLQEGDASETNFEILDRSLSSLVLIIKALERYEETTILVVGLNVVGGVTEPRYTSLEKKIYQQLQVGALFKPGRYRGLKNFISGQRVDAHLSLGDLGLTLKEWITGQKPSPRKSQFPTESFLSALQSGAFKDFEESSRALLIEDFWTPTLLGEKWNQALVAFDGVYYFFGPHLKVFVNSNAPSPLGLSRETEKIQEKSEHFRKSLENLGFSFDEDSTTSSLSRQWKKELLDLPAQHWKDPQFSSILLKSLNHLRKKFPKNSFLDTMSVRLTLELEDWKALFTLAAELNEPLLAQVAQNQFSLKPQAWQERCFQLSSQEKLSGSEIKECKDPLFAKYLSEKAKGSGLREFERLFEISILRDLILRQDISQGLRLDPSSLNDMKLNLFEIYLALPENQKLKGRLFSKKFFDPEVE